jgi:iron complex outermembrane receptor protein
LRAQYAFSLANGGTITMAVEGNYKDKVYFTAFNDDRLSQDAVTTLDANVRFASADEQWSVNVWGKNLTDEFIWSSSFPISTSRTIMGTQAPPRTFGVAVGFDF